MNTFIKLSLTLSIAALTVMSTFAQTYYYEQVAIVNNGVKTDKYGDGHFLTFSGNEVYESNSSGQSLGYGSLKYVRSEGGRSLYVVTTYLILGAELQYVFNGDRSRLNVHLDNSRILVYERKNSVSSPRQYESISIQPSYDDSGSSSGSGSRRSGSDSKKGTTTNSTRTKCTLCHGTGDYITSAKVSEFGIQPNKWCSKCNKTVASDHVHRPCPSCNGTGYRR